MLSSISRKGPKTKFAKPAKRKKSHKSYNQVNQGSDNGRAILDLRFTIDRADLNRARWEAAHTKNLKSKIVNPMTLSALALSTQ